MDPCKTTYAANTVPLLERMVLNYLWLYFITSPAVAVSISGYVCYTSLRCYLWWCFIFLLVLTLLFCVGFFVLNFSNTHTHAFPSLLTCRELTSKLFGAQSYLSIKGFLHLLLCASECLTTLTVSFLLFLSKL